MTLIEELQKELGSRYGGLRPFPRQGTLRTAFLAKWGPRASKDVLVKVDKEPENDHGAEWVGRGYHTGNDAHVLALVQEPRRFGMSQVLDFGTLESGAHYVVEELVKGEDLQSRIERKGSLARAEFHTIFSSLIARTARGLHAEYGLLHRDLKPSNIIVADDLEAIVTDWQNAGLEKDMRASPLPSAGSHWVLDPTIVEPLVGREGKYTQQSEIYALGVDMLFALTGRFWFEYDPEGRFGRFTRPDGTVEDLLEDGRLSAGRHSEALQTALARIPRGAATYRKVIEKCMTVDPAQRYGSLDDLARDFLSRKKRRRGAAPWVAAGLLAVSLGVLGNTPEPPAQVPSAQAPYEIVPEWSDDLTIKSNILEVKANYLIPDGDGGVGDKVLFLPSEKEYVFASLHVRSVRGGMPPSCISPKLKGKAYLEGYPAAEFEVEPTFFPPTEMIYDTWMYGMGASSVKVPVPKGIPDGIYPLNVDLYAPTREEVERQMRQPEESCIPGAEKSFVLDRRRTLVVVGNPSYTGGIGRFEFGSVRGDLFLSIDDPQRTVEERIVYEGTMGGALLARTDDLQSLLRFSLPQDSRKGLHALRISGRRASHEGAEWTAFLPFERRCYPASVGEGEHCGWYLAFPGPDYPDLLMKEIAR